MAVSAWQSLRSLLSPWSSESEITFEVAQSSPHRLGIFSYLLTMVLPEKNSIGSFLK